MSTARFIVADVFDGLRSLPDSSVDLVMSSPPFLALRSYLPADHPDKAKEIGSEATPGEFLDVLLDVVVECRRVLAPHGSLVFELGDTFAGSGGAGGDYGPDGLREGQPKFRQRTGWHRSGNESEERYRSLGAQDSATPNGGPGWPLDKSLCCIPNLFEASLSYGRNLLTGRELEPWRVRNFIAWCRPNPPVGALGDKFRPATSYLTVACMARDRYFDLDAVRTEPSEPLRGVTDYDRTASGEQSYRPAQHQSYAGAGAPPLDWWAIPTAPYKGAHYATYPAELCIRPIKAMCPEKVCRECGEPSRRITGEPEYERDGEAVDGLDPWPWGGNEQGRRGDRKSNDGGITRTAPTLGWSDCGHNDRRPGLVLDPFAGSATTLLVATGHGRDAIGIDLDERNAELARERLGMFLTVETPERAA